MLRCMASSCGGSLLILSLAETGLASLTFLHCSLETPDQTSIVSLRCSFAHCFRLSSCSPACDSDTFGSKGSDDLGSVVPAEGRSCRGALRCPIGDWNSLAQVLARHRHSLGFLSARYQGTSARGLRQPWRRFRSLAHSKVHWLVIHAEWNLHSFL